ncbi:hypothetical protein U9M48_034562 [Paspalum notatum var. saurae]|uniref:Receptor-like protein 12 n=1 Tax=Paspalum notatum var. saurae TaxID=547442 RepID=A0AAQ3X7J2_PASNO
MASSSSSSSSPVPGLEEQASSLLQLKLSFNTTGGDSTTFQSWIAGTDWQAAAGLDPALFTLTSLKLLNLSGNDFNMSQIPGVGFEQLTELTHLDLSDTNFADPVPSGIGGRHQPSLVYLDLSTSFYMVEFDSENTEIYYDSESMGQLSVPSLAALLANLTNLEELRLGLLNLSSSGAGWCNDLATFNPKLQVLSLPYCSLPGSVPEFLAWFPNLTVLQLSENSKLQGQFPPIIFQHKMLQTIDLTDNLGISGVYQRLSHRAAAWRICFSKAQTSQFFYCGLSGPLPSWIGNLKELTKLELYSCNFSGKIPPQISNLTHLETLLLQSNAFVGEVQLSAFSTMPNLTVLNLSDNQLHVVDEGNSSSLISFPKIEFLRLASCRLSTFPKILRHLNTIQGIDLSDNQIQGAIPVWAWDTWKGLYMMIFNLSHNEFTSLGSDDPLLPVPVEYFDLSFNNFTGPIPIPRDGSIMLDYSSNQFSSIPRDYSTYLGDTVFLKASINNLSGNISTLICGTTNILEHIDLSYNNLSGPIPSCLIKDASTLQVLNLRENKFVAEFPDNINSDCALEVLDLSGNWIDGKIPRSLVACRNLEILDIGSNQISDSFPCWMSTLPKLQVLVLKSNKFTGQLQNPPYKSENGNKCEFKELRIFDIASNNFSGSLPKGLFKMLKSMTTWSDNGTLVMENRYYHGQTYQFTAAITYKGNYITISKILRTLVLIDISDNAFYGTIPEDIGDLVLLHGLNMSHNALGGSIPAQFGNLKNLESLDLSSNELYGEIPRELASLNFLSTLNLSYNMLFGRIPESSQFSTFTQSSFLGNKDNGRIRLQTSSKKRHQTKLLRKER